MPHINLMASSPNLPLDLPRLARDEASVKRGFWPKFKRLTGKLPFARDLLAAYYCARDPVSPLAVKATLLAALAYFVLPSDAIPDVLAGLGFTDDAAVLLAALRMVSRHVTEEHWAKADGSLRAREDDAGPQNP